MGYNYIVILCILFAVIGYFLEKNIYNPITSFTSIWAVIVFLCGLQLYNLYDVSEQIYWIVFWGVLLFSLGCLVTILVNKSLLKKHVRFTFDVRKVIINYRWVYIFCTIMTLGYLINGIQTIQLLSNGYSFSDVRDFAGDTSSIYYKSSLSVAFLVYVVEPISMILVPLAALEFFSDKKRKRFLIWMIFNIILKIFANGGRVVLVTFFIYIFIALLIFKKKIELKKETKFLIFFIGILVYFGFVIISQSREIVDINQSIYYYISGCLPYMQYKVAQVDQFKHWTYGYATLNGFITPFLFFIKNIFMGFISYPSSFLTAATIMDVTNFINISYTGITYNYFASLFFYFYCDGGFLGVIFFSFIYGVISTNVYIKAELNKDIASIIVYLIILNGILFSMVRFSFSLPAYALSFLFLLLLFKRERSTLLSEIKRRKEL